MNREGLQLAVIVAARSHGRAAALERCLASLMRARANPGAWQSWGTIEVVVVDDGSHPPIQKVLPEDLLGGVRVLATGRRKGQGSALNHGLDAVRADIYAFTDSDCVVAHDWLQRLRLSYHCEPGCLGVAGPNWLHDDRSGGAWSSWLTRQESRLTRAMFSQYVQDNGWTTRLDCRNLSIRRELVDLVAPMGDFFVENGGPSVSGLTSARLRARCGCDTRIRFDDRWLVWHEPVRSLRCQIRRYFRWGRYGKYSDVYRLAGRGLAASFLMRHMVRHFMRPFVGGGVSIWYLWSVHGAFWLGIVRQRFDGREVDNQM